MRYRLIALICVIVLLLAGGLWSGYWLWSAERLAEGIEAWAGEQRAQGYEIAYEGPEIGGFPLRLTTRFERPRMVSPRGWHWEGPALSGQTALWDPLTIDIDLAGLHAFALVDGEEAQGAELEAAEAKAVVHLGSDGGFERGVLETRSLEFRHADTTLSAEQLDASLGPLTAASGERPQKLAFAGQASGVELPKIRVAPLSSRVERLAFQAVLVGEIPSASEREFFERWRDSGGIVEVGSVELVWDPLTLNGDGSIGLDRKLRPEGAFTARMRGLLDIIDRLIYAGMLDVGLAVPAKLGLAALGSRRDENGERIFVLPITLREGQLFLGPAPLVRLSPVL